MSSLIPEHPIVISPSLATTIGLEEAVLLQLLSDVISFRQGDSRQGYQWFTLSLKELKPRLPFWDSNELQRITNSLKDKGIILIEPPVLSQNEQLVFAINETAKTNTAAVLAPGMSSQPDTIRAQPNQPLTLATTIPRPTTKGAALLSDNWQPDEDLLQLLTFNHRIPRDFSQQQREDFVLYWRDRQQVSHSWPSKFRQHVLKEWRFHQSRQAAAASVTTQTKDLNDSWKPSPDALEILQRSGVSHDFIEDAIPEFVLYWRERGDVSGTWNSKFIAHIRRQWAKYTKAMELDYEPRAIAANWQPSEDVYDILRLATIDIDFARQLVAEFVLFWRDTQEIQRSWNTKFLQHTKYQWATRHHMGSHSSGQRHAGQPRNHQSAGTTAELKQNPFNQLTDRSWAEGIVKDI